MTLWISDLQKGSSILNYGLDAETVEIEPDTSIGLESDNVESAIDELAGDLYEINDMPDLATLFENIIS